MNHAVEIASAEAEGCHSGQPIGFKRYLRAETVDAEAAYLFSERGVTTLTGAKIGALAPLLDGTRDLATLLDEMPEGISQQQVASLLNRLTEAGLVTVHQRAMPAPDRPTTAYWEMAALDPASAVAGAAGKRLQLLSVGDLDAGAVLNTLRAARLDVTPATDPTSISADLSVVLCDDYLNQELAGIDAAHRAAGTPWLLAKPIGTQLWVGPFFCPPEPGCWHCLAVRLWAHRQAEACVQTMLGHRGPAARPVASIPPFLNAAGQLIATEATKWLAGYRYPGQHGVWTLDSLNMYGEHHELRPAPQCRACGDSGLMRAQTGRPVELHARPKVSGTGGGHRATPPEEVLATYRHLISPVTGVVKEIRRDPRGPAFFNSFRAGANAAAGVRNLSKLQETLRIEAGGKGVSGLHAEVSALCEALERHSGNFRGDEERIRGSLRSLGEVTIHPEDCQLFHQRQLAARAAWNATHSAFHYVCEPLDARTVIDWTPVWSLTQRRHRLLPTGLLYYGCPSESGHRYVRADSNGNAAGSCLEEAVLQGLLELVERDAVALWWYNRHRAAALDLVAFGDLWIAELLDVYHGLSREVWALDLTADLGIPVVVAISRRVDKPAEDIMFGFGAHLSPHVAVRRALTELNQLMPALINVGPDGDYGVGDRDTVRWWRDATTANQPYLVPEPRRRARGPLDFDYQPRDDLAEDVAAIQAKLETLGLELLVLDQTRPDVGLPVVKVIVPGMRGFPARFGPGRLYDVPVALGRLPEPVQYEDLNPIPLFL